MPDSCRAKSPCAGDDASSVAVFMNRILLIDVGNSRLKWGVHESQGWTEFGATPNSEVGTLAVRDWQSLPRPERIAGVNVAGEAMRTRVEVQMTRWRVTPQWLVASASAGGVTNRYAEPEQLGADRWAALVATRQRIVAAESFPTAALVVNAGTAVTLDAMDADGVFRGGVIMPGLQLMLGSLAEKTAALKVAPGEYQDFPTNTADALYSGAVQAVSGAIERMRLQLEQQGADVKCFISGGAAGEIAPHLNGPLELVDNLVLEGVLVLAQSAMNSAD